MNLNPQQIEKLEQLLDRIKGETYPETPSAIHSEITRVMLEHAGKIVGIAPGMKVLDVGCGQGVALQHFVSRGCDVTGITLNSIDVEACRQQGYHVLEMDQSFLDFPDSQFDFIWCRHCIEHSIFPFFTLHGFRRVLKPGGWLYIEVPAPDTSCNHQTNKNHYSVLTKSMWRELIERSGFKLIDIRDIQFTLTLGPDTYWAFIHQRVD